MQKLKCSVQNYEWGKIGAESKVAQLFGGEVDPGKTYAEAGFLTERLKYFLCLVVDGNT